MNVYVYMYVYIHTTLLRLLKQSGVYIYLYLFIYRSIKPADIQEVKKLGNPAVIIQLVFDGILLLFKLPLNPVKGVTLTVAKQVYIYVYIYIYIYI
jgi:hypothetical protein